MRDGGGSRPRAGAPIAALAGLVLLVLLGGWLAAAPFALGEQRPGAAWDAATCTDVATGGALAAVALAGLLAYLAAALSWLARYGRR
ncbi:MAG TPA: hypothetical protein VGM10_28965 [Actinocrinis sp.]|jgi:hypothetical protein